MCNLPMVGGVEGGSLAVTRRGTAGPRRPPRYGSALPQAIYVESRQRGRARDNNDCAFAGLR
jgi:hypothetical protein